jgi:hypothetical protein
MLNTSQIHTLPHAQYVNWWDSNRRKTKRNFLLLLLSIGFKMQGDVNAYTHKKMNMSLHFLTDPKYLL